MLDKKRKGSSERLSASDPSTGSCYNSIYFQTIVFNFVSNVNDVEMDWELVREDSLPNKSSKRLIGKRKQGHLKHDEPITARSP